MQKSLQDIVIFDLYRGKGIEQNGIKALLSSITLQNLTQTLTDSEIDATFNRVITNIDQYTWRQTEGLIAWH